MSHFPRKRLLLLRHGETPLTPTRHFVGSTDLDLSSRGQLQAAAMREMVLAHQPQTCLCSPMRRCLQTAQAVLDGSDLQREVRHNLREIDFGSWERRTFAEITQADPEGAQRWLRMDRRFAFGGGEKLGTFFSRVKREAAQIAKIQGETILVVAHGGVIRALVCHYLGLPLKHFFMLDISPASLTGIDVYGESKGMLALLSPCCVPPEMK